jgi:hypothetical protein
MSGFIIGNDGTALPGTLHDNFQWLFVAQGSTSIVVDFDVDDFC